MFAKVHLPPPFDAGERSPADLHAGSPSPLSARSLRVIRQGFKGEVPVTTASAGKAGAAELGAAVVLTPRGRTAERALGEATTPRTPGEDAATTPPSARLSVPRAAAEASSVRLLVPTEIRAHTRNNWR